MISAAACLLADRMRAAILADVGGPEVLVIKRVPRPVPAAGQMLVKVTACGVCGHDVLARRGKLAAKPGAVLGHEIAGVVAALGPKTPRHWAGRRVALVQRIPCGDCPDCAMGHSNQCRRGPGFYGEDLPGGYAEYVVASPLNAVVVPEEVDDVTAAIMSCAIGTGLNALRSADVGRGDVVLVTGASGGLGIHAVQLARLRGCSVIAMTQSLANSNALLAAGAASVVRMDDGAAAVRSAAARFGRGRGVDAVIETTGGPTFATSLRSLRPRGRLVLVGNTEPAELGLDPGLLIVKELSVRGSSHATRSDLLEVLEAVRGRKVLPMTAQVVPLEQVAAAHTALDEHRLVGRAVIRP